MLPSEYLEKGWTQGATARNSDGEPVDPKSDKAVSWCMVGALMAADIEYSGILHEMQQILPNYRSRKYFNLSDYNDSPHRTHDMVIELMKLCEQRARISHVT